MGKFKKKLFGYHPDKVNDSIEELNDLVNSLKRQILDLEKDSEQPSDVVKSKTEYIELLNKVDNLNRIISEKDNQIEQLKSSVKNHTSTTSENNLKEVASLKDEIDLLNTELSNIKQSISSKDEYITKLKATMHKLTTQPKQSPQYSKMIEAVYLRAFESAKHITVDAKNEAIDLTNKVYTELNSSIISAASAQYDLISIKNELFDFISKGVQNFKALEQLTESLPAVDPKTPEYIKNLKESKARIVSEIEKSLADFDMDIEGDIDFSEVDELAVNVPDAPIQPQAIKEPIIKQPETKVFVDDVFSVDDEDILEDTFSENYEIEDIINKIENQAYSQPDYELPSENEINNEQIESTETISYDDNLSDQFDYTPEKDSVDNSEIFDENGEKTSEETAEEDNVVAENTEEKIEEAADGEKVSIENTEETNDDNKKDNDDPNLRITVQYLLKKYSKIN